MKLNSVKFLLICLFIGGVGYSKQRSLDEYLSDNATVVTEGYCTDPQIEQFSAAMRSYKKEMRRILEIGFNAGHSADFFLKTCPKAKLSSFDLNAHPYTQVGLAFIKSVYPTRIEFISGNSAVTIPEYAKSHPQDKFDLIYVDGDHSFEGCLTDIIQCKNLANKETILWIDDYNIESISRAINLCVKTGMIEIVGQHKSYDPKHYWREWVEAKYIN